MTQNADTPDGQVGVVSAQTPLAEVAGGTGTVVVPIPPNAETIVINAVRSELPWVVYAIGKTTGIAYPTSKALTVHTGKTWATIFVSCSSAYDEQLEIILPEAPTEKWYVYGDSAVELVTEPAMAGATSTSDGEAPNRAVLVAGEQAGKLRPLRSSEFGLAYVVPSIPGNEHGDRPIVELSVAANFFEATGELVASPGAAKHLRLFSAVLNVPTAAQTVLLLDSVSGESLHAVTGPGNVPLSLPGQGFPLSTNAGLKVDLFAGAGKVTAVAYYTTETN
jgi:hypothetical protein